MKPRQRDLRVAPLHDGVPRGIYLLPNLVTSMGLFCGIFSIVQTMQGAYYNAALAILVAHIFDGLDGRIARMTNSTSRFGIEYDSLCDLVSFGVAPGLLIYKWALVPWGVWGWTAISLYVICSAIRLARFNILVGRIDSNYFMGLPVPASATMLASVVLMYRYVGRSGLPAKHVTLLLLTWSLALLMVSSIKYPSFKNLKLHSRQPISRFVVLVLLLSVAVAAYQAFLFAGMSLYVASGPALWLWSQWHPSKEAPMAASAEVDGDEGERDERGHGGIA
ncbi:MAG TPA: CDP-diacylglycerol--serine O-phosphatidyltransferase [Candidatus Limnocylindrales bacterium]|nr:CDP-diacylglycerol--serine O-phosphatidyltransferase [Candidatus Limnocylindrales bacterium]